MSYTLDTIHSILNTSEATAKSLLERKSYGLLMDHYQRCIEASLFLVSKPNSNYFRDIHYLNNNSVLDILNSIIELPEKSNNAPYLDIETYNPYKLATIIHFTWIINDETKCNDFFGAWNIQATTHLKKLSFWQYYRYCVCCFYKQLPIETSLAPSKLRGLEKHWLKYCELMHLISVNNIEGIDSKIDEIKKSFIAHNTDKRITNVGMLDPSGNNNLGWDFRLHSIIQMSKQIYQFDITF